MTATATRLDGGCDLLCAPDSRGQSVLRRQWFRAPVHLSKPHHDAGALVVNVVNPTAGLLAGDRLRLHVEVAPDARLVLTTPSATRVHTMRGGEDDFAATRQEFRVAAGGSLEWWPEPLIPQRGARYRQHTVIALAPGAELLFLETVAPGRVAAGEAFAFDELRWATDLRLGDRPLVRERYRLAPDHGHPSLAALRRRFPGGYWGSAFLVAPGLTAKAPGWAAALHARHGPDLWVGVTALGGDGSAFAVRVVAADSLALRRFCRALREQVYAALDRSPPDLRRPW